MKADWIRSDALGDQGKAIYVVTISDDGIEAGYARLEILPGTSRRTGEELDESIEVLWAEAYYSELDTIEALLCEIGAFITGCYRLGLIQTVFFENKPEDYDDGFVPYVLRHLKAHRSDQHPHVWVCSPVDVEVAVAGRCD